MQRRSLNSLLCLTLLLLLVPQLHAGIRRAPHRQFKEQIADLEQQWRIATLNADIPAMDRLLSDDYVGISWTGQVNTKPIQLDRLRRHTLILSRIDLSDSKIKLVGAIAIVTSRAEIDGSNDGAPMRGSFRYTRIYQRTTTGTWKITNFEATRIPSLGNTPHALEN